jgi:hypothetical protein
VTIATNCLYRGAVMAAQTDGSVGAGTYYVEASSLGAAFANPHRLDLIQVVDGDGKVVWNLTSAGSVHTNPARPTPGALLGQFRGASFAKAFAENPMQYDVLQVVGPSGAGIFHVDYSGAPYSD